MQPQISYEVFATIQAIALSQIADLTFARLGFSAALSRLPYRLTERKAVLAIAPSWKELKFLDGGAIASSQIEIS